MAQDGTHEMELSINTLRARTHTERSGRNGKSPVPRVPGFRAWLLAQAGRDDPIGDLAADVRRDPPGTQAWSVEELRDHMAQRRADRAAIRALNEAADEWRACCDSPTAGARIALWTLSGSPT